MRQSSVVQEIIRKERIQERSQGIISVLEVRFGEVDDAIKNNLTSIQNEDTLSYLLRQSVLADKDEIERKIIALSAAA